MYSAAVLCTIEKARRRDREAGIVSEIKCNEWYPHGMISQKSATIDTYLQKHAFKEGGVALRTIC